MKKTIYVMLVVLLTACAAAPTPAPTPETDPSGAISSAVIAEGVLRPAVSAALGFAQGGIVADVLVQAGDQVAAGDVLARLVGIETIQAEISAAQLEQLTAQLALDVLLRSALLTAAQAEKALLDAQAAYESAANAWRTPAKNDASDLELAIDDYITVEQDYRAARDLWAGLLNKDDTDRERRDAQDDLAREQEDLANAYADLLKETAANEKPLEAAQTSLLAAIARLEVARADQARLGEENLDTETLAAARSRLSAAAAHVAAAQAGLAAYELRAPFAGSLLAFDVKSGEPALPGVPVAFLADTAAWVVETRDLAEIDIARVAAGQSAVVRLDAFPEESFAAEVTAINPVGKIYLGDMTYQVTLTLDAADSRFLWNMTATVSIETGP